MHEFEKGQVWSFKGRDVDPSPKAIIISVETEAEMRVVHVSLLGIKIHNHLIPTGFSDTVGHCPIEENSLKSCVVALEGLSEIPDGAYEGLETWRAANGGIFTCSLAECLNFIEETIVDGERIEAPVYYCIEYDTTTTECIIKKDKVNCVGELRRCPYFTAHVHQETCVLTSQNDLNQKEVVESVFFVGEGFEQRGLISEALESYKKALEHQPNNKFLMDKLGIKPDRPWRKFW